MIERVTTALDGSVDWRRTRRMTTGMTQYDVWSHHLSLPRFCWIYDATSAAAQIASDYFCIRKGGADDFRSWVSQQNARQSLAVPFLSTDVYYVNIFQSFKMKYFHVSSVERRSGSKGGNIKSFIRRYDRWPTLFCI